MTSTPRIGYIGLNHHHAGPYLTSLEELPVTITAACEPDPEFDVSTVPALGDVPVYTNPQVLLDEAEIDIAWLTLSNRATPRVIEAAARNGIDVFTEKPAARTADALADLQSVIEQTGITVGFAYAWRGFPPARDLRQLADDGYFGDVRAIDLRFIASQLAFRETNHYLFDDDASRGGIVQWLGNHFLDLVPWILRDPIERVNASLSYGSDAVDVEDGATVQFETRSGAIGTLQTGYYLAADRYDTRIGLYGSGGRAEWDPVGDTFTFDGSTTVELESTGPAHGAPRRRITYEYEPRPGYCGAPGLRFIQEFLDARENAVEAPVTLQDAIPVLRVIDAIYESADHQDWVAVADGERPDLPQ